jgi:hypothetical protein
MWHFKKATTRMAKFTEDTLNNWRYPASDTEETKLVNAEKMVREAIAESDELKSTTTDIFGQGSYANDTNVKINSDIDINVCLSDTIFVQIPEGKKQEDFGYSYSDYKFSEYKDAVENALVKKFGRKDVIRNDKCITVLANTYRVEADVVPTFKYNRHDDNGGKAIGTKFITDEGYPVINYPLQHIENGKIKNSQTQRRFKRLTRIFKRLRYKMIDDKIPVSDNITSFLIECLLWNVPNKTFNDYNSWTERLKQSIIFLYNNTKEDKDCKEWGEVSELLYLFHSSRKWSREDVNAFLLQTWKYLEY